MCTLLLRYSIKLKYTVKRINKMSIPFVIYTKITINGNKNILKFMAVFSATLSAE